MDQQIKGKLTADAPKPPEDPIVTILPVPNPPAQPVPAMVITVQHPANASPPEVYPTPPPQAKVEPERPKDVRPKVKEARGGPSTQEHLVLPHPRPTGLAALFPPRPHPLLWICLCLSILALVLSVPKGHFPTVTGRHKALREKEAKVARQAGLLLSLSRLLPPPLAGIVSRSTPETLWIRPAHLGLDNWRFWSPSGGAPAESGIWWSIEELGDGASVVRSRNHEAGTEVWVLKEGFEGNHGDKSLVNALSHSLFLRDQLLKEIADLRKDVALLTPGRALPPSRVEEHYIEPESQYEQREIEAQQARIKAEWKRLEEDKKRGKERERGIDEREREVAQREQWVLDEMRRLSDKVHIQATELSLEDRITERLKAYQRQLIHGNDNLD